MYKKRLSALKGLRAKSVKEIRPGEVSGGEELGTWSQEMMPNELIENLNANKRELLLEEYNTYKERGEDPLFKSFVEKYGQPNLVYYPCSSIHITPSFTFNHVVYVDMDKEQVGLLIREGYHAIVADVTKLETIHGKQADLMIIFNPQIDDLDALAKPLKVDGYIICNNYHETADNLRRNPNFLFIESLDDTGGGSFIPMTEEARESKNPFALKTMGKCLFKKIA